MKEVWGLIESLLGRSKKEKASNPEGNVLKTKEGARSYMLESTSLMDWKSRAHYIMEVNNHSLPSWWMGLILTDVKLIKLKATLDAKDKENSIRRR